jgi:hypothetical protein
MEWISDWIAINYGPREGTYLHTAASEPNGVVYKTVEYILPFCLGVTVTGEKNRADATHNFRRKGERVVESHTQSEPDLREMR